jgi:pimeloyl-ACP methyl ester carboxylesterase
LADLGAQYRVIVPDLRGHGSSDVPEDRDFSDEAYASDVLAVMDDLGIDSAHVFGYSLGGWIGFELAASSPHRVRSLIVGGAHPYSEDLSGIHEAFTPSGILEAVEALGLPLSEAAKKRIGAFDPALLPAMAPDRVDKTERLSNLQMSCLMFCGTDDERFEGMKRFVEGNDRCDFVSIEGTDHIMTWVESSQVLPPVLEFLQQEGGES